MILKGLGRHLPAVGFQADQFETNLNDFDPNFALDPLLQTLVLLMVY
jgi:hypothetical protein